MAKRYKDQITKELSIDVQIVEHPEDVTQGADILVSVTPSRKALINVDSIQEGMHINAIGADGPGKQELDPYIMTRVSKIVVDSLEQCRKIGEIQHALGQGLIEESNIHAEIGEIINGDKTGRETENEITLFDSTGLSAQDIAAAKIVFEAAKKKGLGMKINLFS
jgi:ornithine cyclodeaminase/alanine dehydrogenase-like protein (mu-crystallin family)